MSILPLKYQFLEKEGSPKMLVEFLKIFGVTETLGTGNNPSILSWAKELGIDNYVDDAIAWCGLEAAIIASRAGKLIPKNPLWALNWLKFGTPVKVAMLGDILVFKRPSGGHVGIYVGEDQECYHVGGGNQSDKSNILRVAKSRCVGIRRPIYLTAQPSNVRVIRMNASGPISQNES